MCEEGGCVLDDLLCGGAHRNQLCKYSSILIPPVTDVRAACMTYEKPCGARERLKGWCLKQNASHWKAILITCVIE